MGIIVEKWATEIRWNLREAAAGARVRAHNAFARDAQGQQKRMAVVAGHIERTIYDLEQQRKHLGVGVEQDEVAKATRHQLINNADLEVLYQ